LRETILNAVLALAILGGAALITNWFARTMYLRCSACGTLNARRRTQCRSCQQLLRL